MKNIKKIFISMLAMLTIGIGAIGLTACDMGGANSDDTSQAECEHNYVIDDAVAANCEKVGLTAGAHCSLCGKVFIKQERVNALGHDFKEYVSNNNATCEKNGTETATCVRLGCDKTNTRQEANSKLTHAMSEEWSYDMEYHWHGSVCGCKAKEDYQKHSLVGLECSVCQNTFTPTEGVVYTVSADGTYAEVTSYTGTDKMVIIAETYNDLPVTHIGDEAFGMFAKTYITSVVIPNSVTHIGNWAFFGLGLTEVVIPSSVTSIGSQAFAYCYNLENIIVDVENKYYCSIDGNLYNADKTILMQYAIGKKNTSFIIPNGVIFIDAALWGSENLTEIVIPSSVRGLESEFGGCYNLTNIVVDKNSKHYCSIDGNLYSADKTKLVQYAVGKKDKSFIVPEGVTEICDNAFSGGDALAEIILPDGLERIGFQAFYGCSKLTEIVIPENVAYIGGWAFYRCSALTEMTIPKSVTDIGEWAFAGCNNLASVIFENAEGWTAEGNFWVDEDMITTKVELSKGNLLVPSIAATYLTTTYIEYDWRRAE